MVPENNLERLLSFILEREKIRARKDSGVPWPWTEDPVLLRYKIANIRREDDKVTRWLARTWRQPHDSDPLLWFSMSVARFINWPPTLEELGYPHTLGAWESTSKVRTACVQKKKSTYGRLSSDGWSKRV